jgi:hypothetical protein
MSKEVKINKLIKHFNKNNTEYFIKNISFNGIDYNKFFNCLLVKDINAIYNIIKSATTNIDTKNSNKSNYITFLSDHFISQDINYFLDKIAKIDKINYKNYLKCLSIKNIDLILKNVKETSSSSSEEAGTALVITSPPGSPKHTSPPGSSKHTSPPGSSKHTSPMGAKVSSKPSLKEPVNPGPPGGAKVKASKKVEPLFLPFDTKREPAIYADVVKKLNTEYKRSNKLKLEAIMRLVQLFYGDKITMPAHSFVNKTTDKPDYKPMEIVIIDKLSLRDNTLLYVGNVLEGPQKGTNVVVKVQPRIPESVNLPISIQVTTELHIMSALHSKCNSILAPKAYAYCKLDPLVKGDLERYVLVSEYLGKDLSRSLKNTSIDNIKQKVILAVKAIQLMHKCNDKTDNRNSYLHLDIKHENIAFTDDKETVVKIIDFGTAEDIYDIKGNRKLIPRTPGDGSPLYMSIMQHEVSIMDYMDDLQAFAWMLLDLLGGRAIHIGMPWYSAGGDNNAIKQQKLQYIKQCKIDAYTEKYVNGTLTKHNMAIIGDLADYTMERYYKDDKYDTDLITPKTKKNKKSEGLCYSEYNDKYYTDIIQIIEKLQYP